MAEKIELHRDSPAHGLSYVLLDSFFGLLPLLLQPENILRRLRLYKFIGGYGPQFVVTEFDPKTYPYNFKEHAVLYNRTVQVGLRSVADQSIRGCDSRRHD